VNKELDEMKKENQRLQTSIANMEAKAKAAVVRADSLLDNERKTALANAKKLIEALQQEKLKEKTNYLTQLERSEKEKKDLLMETRKTQRETQNLIDAYHLNGGAGNQNTDLLNKIKTLEEHGKSLDQKSEQNEKKEAILRQQIKNLENQHNLSTNDIKDKYDEHIKKITTEMQAKINKQENEILAKTAELSNNQLTIAMNEKQLKELKSARLVSSQSVIDLTAKSNTHEIEQNTRILKAENKIRELETAARNSQLEVALKTNETSQKHAATLREYNNKVNQLQQIQREYETKNTQQQQEIQSHRQRSIELESLLRDSTESEQQLKVNTDGVLADLKKAQQDLTHISNVGHQNIDYGQKMIDYLNGQIVNLQEEAMSSKQLYGASVQHLVNEHAQALAAAQVLINNNTLNANTGNQILADLKSQLEASRQQQSLDKTSMDHLQNMLVQADAAGNALIAVNTNLQAEHETVAQKSNAMIQELQNKIASQQVPNIVNTLPVTYEIEGLGVSTDEHMNEIIIYNPHEEDTTMGNEIVQYNSQPIREKPKGGVFKGINRGDNPKKKQFKPPTPRGSQPQQASPRRAYQQRPTPSGPLLIEPPKAGDREVKNYIKTTTTGKFKFKKGYKPDISEIIDAVLNDHIYLGEKAKVVIAKSQKINLLPNSMPVVYNDIASGYLTVMNQSGTINLPAADVAQSLIIKNSQIITGYASTAASLSGRIQQGADQYAVQDNLNSLYAYWEHMYALDEISYMTGLINTPDAISSYMYKTMLTICDAYETKFNTPCEYDANKIGGGFQSMVKGAVNNGYNYDGSEFLTGLEHLPSVPMDIPTGGLTVYMVGNLHVVVPAKVMSLWIKETYEGFYFIYFMLKQLDNDKKMQFKQFIKFLSEAGMLSEQNARNLTTVFIQSASEIRQRG
jgi:hypothetical protein